jgi:IS30 family transposase
MKTPKTEIARRLSKHRSSIHRELARNTGPRGYIPEEAQQRTDIRRWVNHRVRKMDDPPIRKYVCQGLKRYWSPDQIAGRPQRESLHKCAAFFGRDYLHGRRYITSWLSAGPKRKNHNGTKVATGFAQKICGSGL